MIIGCWVVAYNHHRDLSQSSCSQMYTPAEGDCGFHSILDSYNNLHPEGSMFVMDQWSSLSTFALIRKSKVHQSQGEKRGPSQPSKKGWGHGVKDHHIMGWMDQALEPVLPPSWYLWPWTLWSKYSEEVSNIALLEGLKIKDKEEEREPSLAMSGANTLEGQVFSLGSVQEKLKVGK